MAEEQKHTTEIHPFFNRDTISIRVTQDDKHFYTESFDEISNGEEISGARQFFIRAVERALSRKSTVTRDNPEHIKEIQRLTAALEEIQQKAAYLENALSDKPDQSGAIAEYECMKAYFWPYLALTKKAGKADTYFELFKFMLEVLHKGGAFVPDAADRAYINSLKEKENE